MALSDARVADLTNRLWTAIHDGDEGAQRRVIAFIEKEGVGDCCQLCALWIGSAVGIYNIMAPVEAGLALTPTQLAGIRGRITTLAMGRRTAGTRAVMDSVGYVSEGREVEVGTAFARLWATDPDGAADMVVIAGLLLKNAQQTNGMTPSALAMRAAMLRVALHSTRDIARSADWCGTCLGHAARVMEAADDRPTVPGDGTMSGGDDKSFLYGIDLEGM